MLNGDKLRQFRRSRRISLARLCAVTGISISQLSRYECGYVPNVTVMTIRKIEQALGVPAGFFLE